MRRSLVLLLTLGILTGGTLACGEEPTPTPVPTVGPTPTPFPPPHAGWKDVTVHALCMEVDQTYAEIEGKEPQPIAEAAQEILGRLGVQIVAEGKPCDATLDITLLLEAVQCEYMSGTSKQQCYTGSRAEGEMQLAAADRPPVAVPVSGRGSCPQKIVQCSQEPSDAPFSRCWREALVKGFAGIWGPQVFIQALEHEEVEVRLAIISELYELRPKESAVSILIEALEDPDRRVRSQAASLIGRMGSKTDAAVPALSQGLGDKDQLVQSSAALALEEIGPEALDAVPALIEALSEYRIRKTVVRALSSITGQDFGEDAAAWQQWWDAQQ
jgi:hypothetical protein